MVLMKKFMMLRMMEKLVFKNGVDKNVNKEVDERPFTPDIISLE